MQDIDYSKLLSGMLTNIFLDAYNKLEAQQHKGIISAAEAESKSNQILEALLQFINAL